MKFIENPFEFFIMSDYNFSNDMKFIENPFEFFIMSDYKTGIRKYIDGIVLSSLLALIVGYIWAFLGWQVYGRDTTFGIEVLYTHAFTPVPYEVAIFPLWIIYSVHSNMCAHTYNRLMSSAL